MYSITDFEIKLNARVYLAVNSERYTMLISETDDKRDKRDTSTVGSNVEILRYLGCV